MKYELGFIGAGNMAEAICKAAVDHKILSADQIIAADPSEDRRALFTAMGVATADNNEAVITQSKQVLLAVKPQMFPDVVADLAAFCTADQVLISIMSGLRSGKINDMIAEHAGADFVPMRIVRVMPNTPVLVGQGMAGIAAGATAQPGDDDLTVRVFNAGGKSIRIDESLLDSLTATSGSGPAYVFYLAEAMEQAAINMGIDPADARTLVVQCILGAGHLMAESDKSPTELRRIVTSKKGTTDAAIKHMEASGLPTIIADAMKAAEVRGKELGE